MELQELPSAPVMAQTQVPALADTTPTGMMLALLGRGASIEQISQMMDLQERFEKREAEKAFNAAFAAFKAEAVRVVKNRAVTAGPLAGKSYAELFSVVNAVTPALSKHGLSAAWKVTRDEPAWIEVTCTIKHSAGHSDAVSMGGPPDAGGAKNAIQARASTISYLERYTLKAICGIAEGGEDSDGNGDGGDDKEHPKLQAGRDASMNGLKALTEWWGKLTAKDRSELKDQYPSLRRAAEYEDQGLRHD